MSTVNVSSPYPKKYASVSLGSKLKLVVTLLQLPAVLLWTIVSSPSVLSKPKTMKRRLVNAAYRYCARNTNMGQAQYVTGTTFGNYKKWAKKAKLSVVVDELGGDARLLWVGERRTDRVILYLHGGAYLIPMQDFSMSFWRHIQSDLKSQFSLDAGLVILNYSLVPVAGFQTQLKQAITAIEHLIKTGVEPCNIQIIGESAGGHLALAIVSHMLHPLPNVPPLKLQSPLCGVYLMSPWVTLAPSFVGSMFTNARIDFIDANCLAYWGRAVLRAAGANEQPSPYKAESRWAFLEPSKCPDGWYDGMPSVVNRVLITAGGLECLRDDIELVGKRVRAAYNANDDGLDRSETRAKVVVQVDGLHCDPAFEYMVGGPEGDDKGGMMARLIVEWLAGGFDSWS